MDTKGCHQLLVAVALTTCVLCVCFGQGKAEAAVVMTKNATLCVNESSPDRSVQLECPNKTWIHVIQELYSPNCSSQVAENKVQLLDEGDFNVINCFGGGNSSACEEKVDTNEDSFMGYFHGNASISEYFVSVSYECVPETAIKKMGTNGIQNAGSNTTYLASPSLYDPSDLTCQYGCRCLANATGIRVQALYVTTNVDLRIQCGNFSENATDIKTSKAKLNFKYFTQAPENEKCTLDVRVNRSDKAWIRIEARDDIVLQCYNNSSENSPVDPAAETDITTSSSTTSPLETTTVITSSDASDASTSTGQITDTESTSSVTTTSEETTPSSAQSTVEPSTSADASVSSSSSTDISSSQPVTSSQQTTVEDGSSGSSSEASTSWSQSTANTISSSLETSSAPTPASQSTSPLSTNVTEASTDLSAPSSTVPASSVPATSSQTTTSSETITSSTPPTTIESSPSPASTETTVTVSSTSSTGNEVTSSQTTAITVSSDTFSSDSTTAEGSATTGSHQAQEARSLKDEHIYTIAFSVAGVTVIVVVVAIIFCRRRRAKKRRKHVLRKESGVAFGMPHSDVRLPRMTSDNYWEIDLEDNNDDTRMPLYDNNASRGPKDHHAFVNGSDPDNFQSKGKTAHEEEEEPVPLKSFGKGGFSMRKLSGKEKEAKNKEFLASNAAKPKLEFKPTKSRQPQGIQPASRLQEKSSAKQSPSAEELHKENDDEMVMVDNVAYESADNFIKGSRSGAGDGTKDDDDDEEVMIENDIYESSGPRQATNQRHTGAESGRIEDQRVAGRMKEDDEDFMVDNVIYESSGPRDAAVKPQAAVGTSSTPRSRVDGKEDDEDFMLDSIIYESSGPR